MNLLIAASKYGLKANPSFVDWFEDLPLGSNSLADKFLIDVADASLVRVIDLIASQVDGIVSKSGIVLPTQDEQIRIRKRLDLVIPAEGTKTISDIINAGWQAYEDIKVEPGMDADSGLWSNLSWSEDRKRSVLKDLLLKSIEVQDIEAIGRESNSGP